MTYVRYALCFVVFILVAHPSSAQVPQERLSTSLDMNAGLGWSVALNGDGSLALLGAAGETEAYVFTKTASGTWTREATLYRPGSSSFTFFGNDVALNADGTVALIADYYTEVDGNSQEGKVFVFAKSGGTWSYTTTLTASVGERLDQFGRSVALSADGSTALIGASRDDFDGTDNQGTARVFTRDAVGSWSQQEILLASDGTDGDYFGSAVALGDDGKTALVGAKGHDVNTNYGQGSAYVFGTDGTGTWSQKDKLLTADGEGGDVFGGSVALNADATTALVGAMGDDVDNDPQGSAYVFARNGPASWSQQDKLVATDGNEDDEFGESVALDASGTTALVGARKHDVTGGSDEQGSAYTFAGNGAGSWTQQRQLTAFDGADDDEFGNDVALSNDGTAALVGADGNNLKNDNQGSAYVINWPTAQACTQKSISTDKRVDFDPTGAAIVFSGVNKSGAVTVCDIENSPNGTDNISQSNVSSYRFVVDAANSLDFTSAEVRFAVNDLDGISTPSEVTIYKRSPAGVGDFSPLLPTEVDANGTSSIADDEIYASTSDFSEFVFASNSQSLPVELVGFRAHQVGEGTVTLSWQTASETNNAGFRIQHQGGSSEDRGGNTWETVARRDGAGTTVQPQSYQFTAKDLSVGTHQFRLKQVDYDGTTHVHRPTTVRVGTEKTLQLSTPAPNPAQKHTILSLAGTVNAKATLTVYNTIGQRVKTVFEGRLTGGGRERVRFDTTDLSAGLYLLRLTAGGHTQTERLTVVR
ncbi:hypothetical protein BSZ35_16065 [Salinibacter sp. 10B]|uniref:T9SS type A sorting domain-containing protein n=1 Tax=Salinibacter sp. 10B TaxID=1923971 RepID=UPI000CF42403|nr:T9SS type A sorting domain-containing protein [Salinibacter sp. 10B]PQJ35916.1 hypothetical protein BSZ35_16065 [Salinibacter sp. 10B]